MSSMRKALLPNDSTDFQWLLPGSRKLVPEDSIELSPNAQRWSASQLGNLNKMAYIGRLFSELQFLNLQSKRLKPNASDQQL